LTDGIVACLEVIECPFVATHIFVSIMHDWESEVVGVQEIEQVVRFCLGPVVVSE
jgi:hypothetical protein